jgi:2-hydroxymuconate-semialdehyde hydrolase
MIQTTPEIGKSIRAGGVMTNYHEAGSGAPVILIHGSGPGVSAWANWRLAIPSLAERLHVFAYDQVGFGYSELPAQHTYGLGRWTEHLLSFMQAVGIKRAHLLGNSMGAAVALAAAVTHPEVVDRLVLMGPMGVRFPITEGLDAVWGYTPSISNMKRLLAIFTYDHDRFVTDESAELRYRASMRLGMQGAFSSMFPQPRQRGGCSHRRWWINRISLCNLFRADFSSLDSPDGPPQPGVSLPLSASAGTFTTLPAT